MPLLSSRNFPYFFLIQGERYSIIKRLFNMWKQNSRRTRGNVPAQKRSKHTDSYARPVNPTAAQSGQGAARLLRNRKNTPNLSPAITLLAGGLIGLIFLILLSLTVFFTYFAYFQITDRIIPGVSVGEAKIGGKTVQQAAVEIHKVWNIERTAILNDGMNLQVAPIGKVGLYVDPLQTAEAAAQVAHDQNLMLELDQFLTSLMDGWGVAPVVAVNLQAANSGFEDLRPLFSKEPKDASLQLDGDQLVAIPAQIGYTINLEQTIANLNADPLQAVISGQITVALSPLAPRIGDVSAAMSAAQRLLDTPLTIQAYDPLNDEKVSLPLPRQAVAAMLQIQPGATGAQVTINESAAAAYLESLNSSLGERWIDAGKHAAALASAVSSGEQPLVIFNHRPTTYTVQAGDTLLKIGWKLGIPFWMIQRANPELDPDKMWTGQEITIPSKDDLIPLPIVPNKRIVISISQQRLWAYQDGELLGKHVISTGIDRSPTQPGIFQVRTHVKNAYASVWDLHMPHFLGIYEAWPGFMNGIHGLPTLANGQRLWANILGKPASYGCIILDLETAEWLYQWAEDGVIVVIEG